jgi:hypothetical protein
LTQRKFYRKFYRLVGQAECLQALNCGTWELK